jgi:outer membrane protein assembly factor BamB
VNPVGNRATRRLAALIACVTVGTLTLAACSSGGDDSASTTTRAPRSTTTTANAGKDATTTEAPPTTKEPAPDPVDWPTYDHDDERTGVAPGGPPDPPAVKQRWASPVLDGDLYAQPLVVGDRVIVATENDTVYSLRRADGTVEWKQHLGTPVPASDLPCGNVDPVGITSTPVVDTFAGRIYAVGMEQPGKHTLWALDLASGNVVSSTRVDVPGSDPAVQNQRGALTLAHATVYVPFGGRYGDCGDYHGRVTAVPLAGSGLGAPASYTLPTQRQGGFWTPPGASVAPDGTLLLTSGNSDSQGEFDFGNAVVRLSPALNLLDWFAPDDWAGLNAADIDLGTTGPVVLPDARVFQVGKGGVGYLLDANALGHIGGDRFRGPVCTGSAAFGAVAHSGTTLYVPCLNGVVQVTTRADGFTVGWTTKMTNPGPPVLAGTTLWTVVTSGGDLAALDPATGTELARIHIGSVPSRFTSLAAAGDAVYVGADRTMFAFADRTS